MLSAHYTGNSHVQHTPLHTHSVPLLSSHPGQQAQFTHQQHPVVSSLLPTPPSSPPTIGMHPVESTISLLESLVAFYHQERMWVYRTRAQLEMGLFQRTPDSQTDGSDSVDTELDGDSDGSCQLQVQSTSSPDSGKTTENSSPSPPTKWLKRKKAFNLKLEGISTRSMPTVARGGISKHPHLHAPHRARQSSNLNPASSHQSAIHAATSAALHPHQSVSVTSTTPAVSFYPPTAVNTATTLTSPYLSHPSFQFSATANQQPATPGVPPPRYASTPARTAQPTVQPSQSQSAHAGPLVLGAGGHEPTVQILEMFERMMQARMESCERVTKMVREANKPGGTSVGGTGRMGVVGGVSPGSIGGPVGGFGGPVGLPVGIGPQGIVGGYPAVQTTAEGQDAEMIPAQTPAPQGFPMEVNMG